MSDPCLKAQKQKKAARNSDHSEILAALLANLISPKNGGIYTVTPILYENNKTCQAAFYEKNRAIKDFSPDCPPCHDLPGHA